MKVIIVFSALLAVVLAAVETLDRDAVAVKSEFENIGVEGYKFGFETSNGISQEATGEIINAGTDNEAVAVRGQYSYTGKDGTVYSVKYVADQNGFQPEGEHLPTNS